MSWKVADSAWVAAVVPIFARVTPVRFPAPEDAERPVQVTTSLSTLPQPASGKLVRLASPIVVWELVSPSPPSAIVEEGPEA